MTVKVTRKNLKEIASNLDNCYYITGNVYDYENIIEYIQNYNITSNEVMKHMNSSKYKNIDEQLSLYEFNDEPIKKLDIEIKELWFIEKFIKNRTDFADGMAYFIHSIFFDYCT
mgnify:CR=1 FL=1